MVVIQIDYTDKYMQLLQEQIKTNEELARLTEENTRLKKELLQLKKHNKRGAGRPKKNIDSDIELVNLYRSEGKTVKEIAELLGCSERRIYRILEVKKKGSNENMENKKYGWLGYNNNNDRYGILNKMDLWEDDGLHCGECLDVVIDGEIVPTRIEMKGKTWYLVDTGLEGEELEGIKVVIK